MALIRIPYEAFGFMIDRVFDRIPGVRIYCDAAQHHFDQLQSVDTAKDVPLTKLEVTIGGTEAIARHAARSGLLSPLSPVTESDSEYSEDGDDEEEQSSQSDRSE